MQASSFPTPTSKTLFVISESEFHELDDVLRQHVNDECHFGGQIYFALDNEVAKDFISKFNFHSYSKA